MKITLRAEDLASKWGFGDGDALEDFIYNITDDNPGFETPDRNEFLYYVIKKFLLPKIDAKLDVHLIGSNHNPVRTWTVDGEEVDHFDNQASYAKLRGIEVEITAAEILTEIERFKSLPPRSSP